MSSVPRHRYTVEEYLDFERGSDSKHEYYAGEIFAMVGASEPHVLIVTNVVIELGSQLKGRRCKVYSNDMRLKVGPTGLYTYPDVMAVCGEAEFDDAQFDTLLNPNVVIEAFSPSTEDYDRGAKFEHCRRVPSLTDYVLISQSTRRVEHYSRQADGGWLLTEVTAADGVVQLKSIGCELRLGDIYDKIDLPG
ncbi:MAG: Uma2 family endonuclease [Planctomycetaceae bacterium]